MSADPRRIIVTETCCHACSVRTIHVHHEHFPEMRIEDISAEQAARHSVNRLEAARGTTADSLHREAVRLAIDDIRAFLDREGAIHLGRDASGTSSSILKGPRWGCPSGGPGDHSRGGRASLGGRPSRSRDDTAF